MRVAVLGAGVIGVTTAFELASGGADVVVIDRQPGAGLEASFANGGQISANHATPWATPSAPLKALKWLGRVDAPLLLHLRWDPPLFAWLARFLANCTAARLAINVERALRVALYSRRRIAAVRAETGIAYDHLGRGILHLYRSRRDYDEALAGVDLMNRLGCTRTVVDADGCVAIEPALAPVRPQLIGGIYSPDDESGDAHRFTVQLAELAAARGARFRFGVTARHLLAGGGRISAVDTDHGTIAADAFVVALGSYTPRLLAPLGLALPIYPGKGYSVTLPIRPSDGSAGDGAPTVSLIDDEHKMVYSRLGMRLRVAGTAEFIGYDTAVNPARARFLLDTAMRLFPHGGDAAAAEFWAGLRPSTPDGVPVIGRTRYSNLFLNSGHGTLGWTMACGSARVVADLVLGRTPEIDLAGLGLERFG
ncbi:MAG: D-amino acid dehydrogenase [Rhodospirillales bacterium]|jgi:D-amino-acid dehydrogenase|nr:D-amino acid dehydrogenase [Rhodospirillales bacterium]